MAALTQSVLSGNAAPANLKSADSGTQTQGASAQAAAARAGTSPVGSLFSGLSGSFAQTLNPAQQAAQATTPVLASSGMASRTQRRTNAGWTATSIAHNSDLHDAAHSALEPTSDQKALLTDLTGKILGTGTVPSGVPVGMANTAGGGGIPATIQSAIGNLQTNTQNYDTLGILQKFLGALGASRGPSVVVNTSSPAMDQYYSAKTQIMSAPAQLQNQITAQNAASQKAASSVFDPITGKPSASGIMGGSYEGSAQQKADQTGMGLLNQQNQAKQAAASTGWLPYMPNF